MNAPHQGRQTYHSLLSILAMVDRPALKQLYASNYDPLNLTLTVSDSNSTIYDSLSGVVSFLVNVSDTSGSTPIIMADQKMQQLKEVQAILTN